MSVTGDRRRQRRVKAGAPENTKQGGNGSSLSRPASAVHIWSLQGRKTWSNCRKEVKQIGGAEVEKVVNPIILDDRKYFQNQNLAENISKT